MLHDRQKYARPLRDADSVVSAAGPATCKRHKPLPTAAPAEVGELHFVKSDVLEPDT